MQKLPINSPFRIAFNSLGGQASVNHLHFHLFSSNLFERTEGEKVVNKELLPIETINFPLKNGFGAVNDPLVHPSRFFVFEMGLKNLVERTIKCIKTLQLKEIPHNLIICPRNNEKKYRVFLIPRKRNNKKSLNAADITIACLEYAGLFCCKRATDFENFGEKEFAEFLLNENIENEEFEHLKSLFEELSK
ncbi:hypothetical protein MHBO_001510 [Bonamia ostreae]|uniref:GDP-D-glucose phosphorylase 1 n=1 Tax=Bonamia ostreae TaxID=126728 RepID=A0ABV2AJ80_9EUKA